MDRPTCGTCPYWQEHEESKPAGLTGECHRNPPLFAGSDYQMEEWLKIPFGYFEGTWPDTHGEHGWCGEHPDFPEYIASLKPTNPQLNMNGLSVRARNIVDDVCRVTGKTVLDLTNNDLQGVRNCGNVTLCEILNFITANRT